MTTKARRARELAERIDGVDLDATEKAVTIEQDGQTLVGDRWILPSDYIDDDVEHGRLISLKGMTDVELQTLERTT